MTWSVVARDPATGAFGVAVTTKAFACGGRVPWARSGGGDKRGKQSAALRIHSTEDYADVDLRVDDAAEPLAELRRLYEVWRRDYLPMKELYPTRARPAGIHEPEEVEALWARVGRDTK